MSAAVSPHTVLRRGEAVYRFFHGNCLDILPQLSSASVQTIVTSPPCNLGVAPDADDVAAQQVSSGPDGGS